MKEIGQILEKQVVRMGSEWNCLDSVQLWVLILVVLNL